MAEIDDKAAALAQVVSDYRAGSIARPDAKHVVRWVEQFAADMRVPILTEMTHVLASTYLSRERALNFLSEVALAPKLVGKDAKGFWSKANLLDIQLAGNSQSDVLVLFDEVLQSKLGLRRRDTGNANSTFVYLDDGMFTGNRIRRDLEAWLADAPNNAELHVIVFALFLGTYYARGELTKAIKASGKSIAVTWWRMLELEDRKASTDVSDVLRPVSLPDDPLVKAYVDNMRYKPHLRSAGDVGKAKIFSSDKARQLLETEFLKAGVKIRVDSPYLGESQRPLGHSSLETLGFGSMIVTYRNCPNNAPLALWAGDPWYPLFERTTNRQAAVNKAFALGSKSWD